MTGITSFGPLALHPYTVRRFGRLDPLIISPRSHGDNFTGTGDLRVVSRGRAGHFLQGILVAQRSTAAGVCVPICALPYVTVTSPGRKSHILPSAHCPF